MSNIKERIQELVEERQNVARDIVILKNNLEGLKRQHDSIQGGILELERLVAESTEEEVAQEDDKSE